MTRAQKIILWAPRVLAIAFAAFLSMFAMDVFSAGYGFPEVLLALLMHLMPTLALVALIVLAWKKPLIGGIAFLLLGGFFFMAFDGYESLAGFFIVCFPVLLTGVLFLVSWKKSGNLSKK